MPILEAVNRKNIGSEHLNYLRSNELIIKSLKKKENVKTKMSLSTPRRIIGET